MIPKLHDRRLYPFAVGVIVLVGLAVRLDGITRAPLDADGYESRAVIIRQYHSALLARAYYLDWRSDSTPAERQLAAGTREDETLVEPPLFEGLAAALYVGTGAERLWIPRLLAALSWIAGGFFLLAIARRITSPVGALVALAIYMLLPFGIVASRSFQPDPVMVALTLGAALAILRYADLPDGRRFLVAALSASAASLVKPGWSLFFLIPLFLAVAVLGRRPGEWPLKRVAGFIAIAAAPSALWVAYGQFIRDFLQGQASDKIQPSLLVEPSMWKGWLAMVADVLNPAPTLESQGAKVGLALVVVVVVFGLIALRGRAAPRVLAPLWVGYVLFGVVLATHIQNHNYYSLWLIPLAALTVGAAVPWLAQAVGRVWVRRAATAAFAVAAIASLAFLHGELTDPAAERKAQDLARLGSRVDHASVLVLGPDYARPLAYHGRLRARWWPTYEQRFTVAELLAPTNDRHWPAPAAMRPPPSFFLAHVDELPEEPALQAHLETHLERQGTISGYAVYGLRDPGYRIAGTGSGTGSAGWDGSGDVPAAQEHGR